MFKVGDRVEIIATKNYKKDFFGCTGTIDFIGIRQWSPYDTLYGVKIDGFDRSLFADESPYNIWTYGYSFEPNELQKVEDDLVSPYTSYYKHPLKPKPPKKRKWYQWGTTPYKDS